ncbi:MAG: ATP-binding cassette domain-containing protein [Pedobacter sp.]|nr:MAG: ATP-binding cassette domain-containing protein [Pedobacter sp.]
MLVIQDLTKSFETTAVLKGLSLSLKKGENLVILGKSGTGKSVLIKCIVRLLNADSGSINVLGEEITNLNNEELSNIVSKR